MTDREIIRRLAAIDPTAENEYGEAYCVICGRYKAIDDPMTGHARDCAWLAARDVWQTAMERMTPTDARELYDARDEGQDHL